MNQLTYSKFLTVLSVLILLLASRAWAHAYPEISSPSDGAALKESPREVRIKFSEGVEIAFSQILVKGSNNEIVSQGALRQLADDTVAIDIKPLGPGNYVIEWQALSVDTHITDGTLRFSVLPKGK